MEHNTPGSAELESKALKDEHLEQVNGGIREMVPTDAQLRLLQRGQCPRCWKIIPYAKGGWFCQRCNVYYPFSVE